MFCRQSRLLILTMRALSFQSETKLYYCQRAQGKLTCIAHVAVIRSPILRTPVKCTTLSSSLRYLPQADCSLSIATRPMIPPLYLSFSAISPRVTFGRYRLKSRRHGAECKGYRDYGQHTLEIAHLLLAPLRSFRFLLRTRLLTGPPRSHGSLYGLCVSSGL